MNKIALLMAMQGEAQPIIDFFNLKELAFINPIKVFSNEDQSLILSLNGHSKQHGVDNIATQAASLNAHIIIDKYQPNLIINCGTSGGFKAKNAEIADVYISSEKICFHDRRINLPGGYPEYAKGNYPCIQSDFLAQKFDLKQGVVSSSNSLDYSPTDMKIMIENNTSVKEMEAAAIAWVCQINNTPFTAIKSITDIIDGPIATEIEFLSNFEKASVALKEKIVAIVNYLII